MMSKLKLTGVLLGVVASAVLASRRTGMRRQGESNRNSRADNSSEPPRQPETRLDAGGQTA